MHCLYTGCTSHNCQRHTDNPPDRYAHSYIDAHINPDKHANACADEYLNTHPHPNRHPHPRAVGNRPGLF